VAKNIAPNHWLGKKSRPQTIINLFLTSCPYPFFIIFFEFFFCHFFAEMNFCRVYFNPSMLSFKVSNDPHASMIFQEKGRLVVGMQPDDPVLALWRTGTCKPNVSRLNLFFTSQNIPACRVSGEIIKWLNDLRVRKPPLPPSPMRTFKKREL